MAYKDLDDSFIDVLPPVEDETFFSWILRMIKMYSPKEKISLLYKVLQIIQIMEQK